MIELIESPEFWTSAAFILVVILSLNPLHNYLTKWGEAQAKQIQDSENEAAALFNKATILKNTYEQTYQNRDKERKKILQDTDKQITFLEQEIQTKTQDKITHKKQEVALRLKTIQENDQQAVKTKLLTRIITTAHASLAHNPPTENADQLVKSISDALDQFKSALH